MPIYPSSGGFIGSLLRTIQEERSKAPHVLPPAAEPKAPVRAAVQAPLEAPIAPESPGSARVISIRPEGAPPTSAAVPAGKVIPPQSYAGGVGSGGISPIMREKFPEAFNGSEKSAVQNQFSVGTSGTSEAPTQKSAAAPSYEAQIAESGRKIAALDKQLEQLARFEPQPDAGAAERAKNSLIAANQRRAAMISSQPARTTGFTSNLQTQPPGQNLFQQLSSGIQTGAQKAASKIKSLFQRLW